MKKWYQGIVVEHKELDNKMYHCFDDENFEKLTNERNEQLKEIERLNNGIKELDNMFYEIFRISQKGYYSISEWELKEFTDKIQELKGSDK